MDGLLKKLQDLFTPKSVVSPIPRDQIQTPGLMSYYHEDQGRQRNPSAPSTPSAAMQYSPNFLSHGLLGAIVDMVSGGNGGVPEGQYGGGKPANISLNMPGLTSATPTPRATPTPTPIPMPTVTPPPDSAALPYYTAINDASKQYDLPENLLYRLLKQESHFNPTASSSAGAQGIAQFMPGTAKGLGIDPLDPYQAIPAAGGYLRRSYDKFGGWDKALAAYNAGGAAVNKYGGVPPFKETQDYVAKILGLID